MKKLIIYLILGILLIGIVVATLTSNVRNYIIDNFQNSFNIEIKDPII